MHFISCFSFEFSLFEGLSVELFENDMIHTENKDTNFTHSRTFYTERDKLTYLHTIHFKIEIIYTVILIEKCKYDYLYKMYVQEKVHNIITIDI